MCKLFQKAYLNIFRIVTENQYIFIQTEDAKIYKHKLTSDSLIIGNLFYISLWSTPALSSNYFIVSSILQSNLLPLGYRPMCLFHHTEYWQRFALSVH